MDHGFMKVAHHGSKYAKQKIFIEKEKVMPTVKKIMNNSDAEIKINSSAKKNRYGRTRRFNNTCKQARHYI